MLRRAVTAFLVLPGVFAFLVPLLVARLILRADFRWMALVLLVPGTALLLWCLRELYVHGKGTLAPWDPPRHLVRSGPYRVSRNPMYLALVLILLGWAIGFGSMTLLAYAAAVLVIVHRRVVVAEEPILARTHRDEWKQYAARTPRWLFRSRRAVVAASLVLLLILPLGGLIYEAFADGMAAREFAPSGMLVDMGGRRLHLLCLGDGEPTVFFESSGWGTAASSARARERIAATTTVCSYDRVGTGWSDAAPGVATAEDLARDLAVLQDRAKRHGPHVIVASSIGGLTAEMFARQYPERVAGLVFVDAANSLTLRAPMPGWATPAVCTSRVLAHFGLVRLIDPFGWRDETSDEARRGMALTYSPRPWAQLCAMLRGFPQSGQQFEQADPLAPDLPMTVLSASSATDLVPPAFERFINPQGLRLALRGSHQQLARLSTNGRWRIVPDSTHLIADSQPDAVADAVIEMLETLR